MYGSRPLTVALAAILCAACGPNRPPHPDPAPGEPIAVNPCLVAAMVAGYRQHREPTALERESLLDATRFGVAFVGSLRFAWTGEQGWSERIEGSLRRLQARYTAAEEVARLAREAFGGPK